jgi:hypothetical protein
MPLQSAKVMKKLLRCGAPRLWPDLGAERKPARRSNQCQGVGTGGKDANRPSKVGAGKWNSGSDPWEIL